MGWLEMSSEQWSEARISLVDVDEDGFPTSPVVVVTAGRDRSGDLTPPSAMGPIIIVVAERPDAVGPQLREQADVILVGSGTDSATVTVEDPLAEARALAARVVAHPIASVTLVWLLRSRFYLSIPAGLMGESTAYSMLLASDEFTSWRRARPVRSVPDPPPSTVRTERTGDVLRVEINDPGRRNAMSAHMRDALLEALAPAVWDSSLRVVVEAVGPSFGSGGDLDEFGTAADMGRAHVIRCVSSVGHVLATLGDRVEVVVHGECFGAGIEVPAFAHRVTARRGAGFTLPEIGMGLIPGAGGTTSIPRRIGRGRTAWWALTGRRLDAATALQWGLVDAVI